MTFQAILFPDDLLVPHPSSPGCWHPEHLMVVMMELELLFVMHELVNTLSMKILSKENDLGNHRE